MIVPRPGAKAVKPSLTKRILEGLTLTIFGLSAHFLYVRDWTVDDNTKWLMLCLNILALRACCEIAGVGVMEKRKSVG